MKSLAAKILLYIVAFLFLFSAIAKLFPVVSFEFTLGSYGIPWSWTPYLARFIITLELILGCLLLLQIRLKKFTIPLTIGFLVSMTLVLLYRWMTAGADADCGCMGEWISMTPLQSIAKNIILILLLIVIYKSISQENFSKIQKYLLIPSVLASIFIPYIIEPVYVGVNTNYNTQESYPLDIPLFYTQNQKETPQIDLNKGKHIIVFLSVSCPHCKKAGVKLGIMHQQHPEFPIYLFINGDKEAIQQFREENKCTQIPYSQLLQPQFLQLSGPNFPAIKLIENGEVIRQINYLDMDNTVIEDFLD